MVQNICHYLGYNKALSKFSEFSLTVFYSEIASEIYKGNYKKNTKENIGQRDYPFFTPYNISKGDL